MNPDLSTLVAQFISEEFMFGDPPPPPDEDLFASGILDSMSFLRLLAFFGDRFGVEVSMADITMDRFSTIDKATVYLTNAGAKV